MNPKDPKTWSYLGDHPIYGQCCFDSSWYDGDSDADLNLLREAALRISDSFPDSSCELIVLDDSTMFVRVLAGNSVIAEICPTETEDNYRGYFIDLLRPSNDNEIRVRTVEEVVQVLRAAEKDSVSVPDGGGY
jgi:hypothetical protein